MPFPQVVAALPSSLKDQFTLGVKRKFDAYFSFTGGLVRSVKIPDGPGFIYPHESMIPDLTVLWSLFNEVFEILKNTPTPLASVASGDRYLLFQIQRMLEGTDPEANPPDLDGSFWHFPKGRVQLQDALSKELPEVLRTLRNGYSHYHWLYGNLSAIDYWNAQGWDTTQADPRFDLHGRPAKNHMAYIADARNKKWNPNDFWGLRDLRILVTPFHLLRLHLHLFLAYFLDEAKIEIFGVPFTRTWPVSGPPSP